MYAVGSSDATTSWTETISRLHGRVRIEASADLHACVDWQMTDQFRLVHWAGGAEHVSRDPQDVRADPRGTVEILFPLRGAAEFEQSGRRARVGPQSTLMSVVDRPLLLRHSAGFEALALVIPESRLAGRIKAVDQHPTLSEGRTGLARVAVDILQTIRAERAAFTAAEFESACERALDLSCLSLSGAEMADADHRSEVRATIRRFVVERVADPQLDGHMIAAALGWSLRYVQAVLRDGGVTPSELIRNARLDLARVQLEQQPYVAIGRVAADCGFGSHAAFSTAFRGRFGIAPRELRNR